MTLLEVYEGDRVVLEAEDEREEVWAAPTLLVPEESPPAGLDCVLVAVDRSDPRWLNAAFRARARQSRAVSSSGRRMDSSRG